MENLILEKIEERNIVIIGDLHLIKYDKTRHMIYERSEEMVDSITIEKFKKVAASITEEDYVIFLGDIIDAEAPMMPSVANIIKDIKGVKILVRGNNDIMSDYEYRQMSFSHVCWAIHRNDVLFSHTSIPRDSIKDRGINKIIHGHIHRPNTKASDIFYYHRPAGNLNIHAHGGCLRLSDVKEEWYNRSSFYVMGRESMSAQLCQNCAIGYVFDTLPVVEEE